MLPLLLVVFAFLALAVFAMARKTAKKPTLSIGLLIHIVYQIENLTGYTADQLVDMILAGNVSDSLKKVFIDTFNRLKNEPVDIGVNSALYAIIYKYAKKNIGPMCGRVDMGFFYLKAI